MMIQQFIFQYKGQYDEKQQKPKKRDKPIAHVQWNLQANREKTISIIGEEQFDKSNELPETVCYFLQ